MSASDRTANSYQSVAQAYADKVAHEKRREAQLYAAEAEELQKRSALDTQEGGDHYRKMGAYQPWEVLAKWMTPDELRGFAKGTVIAYLAREQDKGGRLDIKKAMHTLQIYLELSEGEQ